MKKIFILISFLALVYSHTDSQVTGFDLMAGTGTYSMSGLRDLNWIIRDGIPFDTKVVADFPPYLNYSAYGKVRKNNTSVGLVFSFLTTGSRISGKDYSGEYYFDNTVNAFSPGIYSEFAFAAGSGFEYSFYSVLGMLFTELKMHEYLYLLETEVVNDRYRYKSGNLFYEPGFRISYPAGSLKIGFNAGYLLQFGGGSFRSTENSDNKLVNPYSGDEIRPGWNGFRTGISVGWYFAKKTEQ